MRLLFISSLYAPDAVGGAEITLERIADGLVKRGHQVAVLTTGRSAADQTIASGVLVMRRRIANLFPLAPMRRHSAVTRILWHVLDCFNPGGYLQTRAAIRQFVPDAVITDTLGGLSVAVWPAATHEKVPIVHRICDAYLLSPSLNILFAKSASPAGMFRRLVRWPHSGLSKHVTAVISLSTAILELHRHAGLFTQTPAEIIRTAFAVDKRPTAAIAGPIRLGFIGQLVPTKGIEALLQGFITADVDATLDIAGSGEAGFVAALSQRFADPRVRFLGWVSNKPGFFSQIDLCLVPSRIFDTLPTVVIESFANHVPVLASGIGGIPEMIVAGKNGLLADLSGPEQVAAAIRSIAADPQGIRDMTKTTAAASAQFLNPTAQLDRWEAVLQDVIGASADGGDHVRAAP